ncbi:ring-cleaving dioxygenase [Amorphus orientalis]|uniref:Glyoxalase family protein n=1 Tax=Amorphus orientalis TaxID=649198 RepID=A0AAE3VR39_9HYPH|nr:ring-cleaving dioxygenase [Amorphus orientalis]MDQ0316621.1 glyoxalase family protein [Amorphus orientalis]
MSPVNGLHHVTAISSSAQGNVDFFGKHLGLRLVKKTVNFDDPGTYHLYFADEVGTPGSVLTFFPWAGVPSGRAGTGEAGLTQFAVPRGTLDFWKARLEAAAAAPVIDETVFEERRLRSQDPDGFAFALVESDDGRPGWASNGIGADAAVKGFRGVTLTLAETDATKALLTGLMGYSETERDGNLTRLVSPDAAAGVVDLLHAPDQRPAGQGAGRVHHIAFRVADRQEQAAVRETLMAEGFQVTPQIDRNYFFAIYFRSPDGVLFEVATDEPGFATDEPVATLGEALKLPDQHEHLRPLLEKRLPELVV